MPSQVGRDLATYFPTYRASELFLFVQDKWVVTPKLTLDFGLRWEYYPPATPRFPGGFSNYNPVNNTLVIAGVGDNPINLGMKTQYKYFAPRFGAAYRMTESTVFRLGYGISYTTDRPCCPAGKRPRSRPVYRRRFPSRFRATASLPIRPRPDLGK